MGSHQNGSVSTASAAVSIASWTGLPTTGTTDARAPPTRIGTVATFVKRHPDSPNSRSRSVSHLIPDISKPPSHGRRQAQPADHGRQDTSLSKHWLRVLSRGLTDDNA